MKMDGRKISHQALEEIRIRAVKQARVRSSPEAVIAVLSFDRRTINKWLALFNVGGFPALKAKALIGRPRIFLPLLGNIVFFFMMKFSPVCWEILVVRTAPAEEFV